MIYCDESVTKTIFERYGCCLKTAESVTGLGARGETRTRTTFRSTDFKSVASTSSATRAVMLVKWRQGTESNIALRAPIYAISGSLG